MKIGELAKRSGLSASRIRFYEASGLVQPAERQANGYRHYGDDTLWILEIISGAQNAGFSLSEIRTLLPIGPNQWQHGELLASLRRKLAEIEAMQKRLAQNKAQLLVAIDSMENRPADLACADRPQWVLDRLRKKGLPTRPKAAAARAKPKR